MAEVKKTFEGTYEDENGNIHAIPKVDVPEGKREGVKITKFEETRVDENGNLIATGRDGNHPVDGGRGAKVIKEFEDTIDHGTYLEAVPKVDVKHI